MGLTALGKADEKNTGKMGKILEKLMKKYWKNAKNTGKVYEKILENAKKNWKSQGNSSVQKSGNHGCWTEVHFVWTTGTLCLRFGMTLLSMSFKVRVNSSSPVLFCCLYEMIPRTISGRQDRESNPESFASVSQG